MGTFFCIFIPILVPLAHDAWYARWARAVATLCNKGEAILTSEWTYPSAMYTMMPYEVSVAPVAIDSQGMRSDNLLSVLKGWDQNTRGAPRYTNIPIRLGCVVHLNMTGHMSCILSLMVKTPAEQCVVPFQHLSHSKLTMRQTMGAARKKEIYDICVQYGA